MGHTKRTVQSMTVMERHDTPIVVSMARFTHKMCSKAAKDCQRAAIHAFPVNLDITMLATRGLSNANLLEQAVFTHQVFLVPILIGILGLFLFTVNKASKVRFLTTMTLIERASVKGIL